MAPAEGEEAGEEAEGRRCLLEDEDAVQGKETFLSLADVMKDACVDWVYVGHVPRTLGQDGIPGFSQLYPPRPAIWTVNGDLF